MTAPSRAQPHRFYLWLAVSFAAVTLLAFVPTYWRPLVEQRLDGGSAVLHVHAVLFSAWPLLFLAQTWLAARAQIRWHRRLGIAGAVMAVAMVVSGLWVTASSIDIQSALGYPVAARGFAIISFTKLAFFAACIALAIRNIRRPEYHKRLMVLAMLPLVQTAIPRILFALFAPDSSPQRPGLGEPASMLIGVPAAVVIMAVWLGIAWHDRRRLGRMHPVYSVGGAALLAMEILRVPLSTTSTWQTFAAWLAELT